MAKAGLASKVISLPFARIVHHHDADAGSDYWTVESKNGLVSRYGSETPASTHPATVADPSPSSNLTKILAWRLTETHDTFGNRLLCEYDRDRVVGPRRWDQLYPVRIRYADYTAAGGAEQFLVSVSFHYEQLPDHYEDTVPSEQRIYPFSDYRAGFEIRNRRRCTRIEVHTHPDSARPDSRERGVWLRSYALIYLDQRTGDVPLSSIPRNGVSLLSQIVATGYQRSTRRLEGGQQGVLR